MPIPWPEEYTTLKEPLHKKWKTQQHIVLLREFTDGKSSARVFAVDIESEIHRGMAILKLDKKHPWSALEDDETIRYQRAAKTAPGFAEAHLPQLLEIYKDENNVGLLSTVAGDTFINTQPWSRLHNDQKRDSIRTISQELLDEWNSDYLISEETIHPQHALLKWLGYRIDPSRGGMIHTFVEDVIGLGSRDEAFSLFGDWLPNPFAYATDPEIWPSMPDIKLAKGRIHGDLHSQNILVRIAGRSSYWYFLIDLALFEEDTFLFYDHAYFELSQLLRSRHNVPVQRWVRLLKALCQSWDDANSDDTELEDAGIVSMIKTTRLAIKRWISNHERNREDFLAGQTLLSRIAVGLNFVNKNLSEQERRFAFLYAAFNLKSFFSLYNIESPYKGPPLEWRSSIAEPQNESWRSVLDSCERFDHHRNTYLLITGPAVRETNPNTLKVLGQIEWSLVLDFDEHSNNGGIYEAVVPNFKRKANQSLPDNRLNTNFKEAALWLMARGLGEREDTVYSDYDSWRRHYMPAIREVAKDLQNAISPQPAILLIVPQGLSKDYIRILWECFDEVFAERATFVILKEDGANLGFIANKTGVKVMQCSFNNFVLGLWELYGSSADPVQILLPKRKDSSDERTCIFVDDEDYRYLKEDLEVIHPGLVEQEVDETLIGMDFWMGHEITWSELDMNADVTRDIAERLKKEITRSLEGSRTVAIPLYHTPGAGGTTLSKRIAWDLKTLYPTVRVHNISTNTASRLEWIFHETGLPILVVMEAANVPSFAREQLYKELKSRNVRAVFLYIVRAIKPRGRFSLKDPVSANEAWRFYEKYKPIALQGRESLLRRLCKENNLLHYRSPFFFGLYAFEEQFVHVPDFVEAHLQSATPQTMEVLAFLALVTRFSQNSLSTSIIKDMLNLSPHRRIRLDEIFGEGPARLVLYRHEALKILHPLIAEEILKKYLNPSSQEPDVWKDGLTELSSSFIEKTARIAGSDSRPVLDIFYQMFISREPWEERADRLKHFSELILMVPNVTGQHRILKVLKDACPDEAHFWNHLGRHHIYAMRSTYELAETCLRKAIELEPQNDIHHHALGMVYRSEVRNRFRSQKRQKCPLDEALGQLKDLVEKAEDCFSKARKLDPETEYGYITNIQLLTEVIAHFFQISDATSYEQFLTANNETAAWCRQKLAWAEELLRRVKNLQAQDNLSGYTIRCQAGIEQLYGHLGSMIQSLQRLLNRSDAHHPQIRRMMANAYQAHRKHDWNKLKGRDLRRIYELMEQNLEEEPTNTRDLLMWLQAYRRLRDFDMLEAIDRLNRCVHREEVIEAHYYLYILHFLRWRQGLLDDRRFVTDYIDKCKSLAGKTVRTRSFEWLAKQPEWCPLLHQSELGDWDESSNFYKNIVGLARIEGSVKLMKGPQAGYIALGPFNVFFVPGQQFFPGRDENQRVTFNLGFSYEGFRAWNVERVRP